VNNAAYELLGGLLVIIAFGMGYIMGADVKIRRRKK
jgi:hypothetical protein